MAPGIALKSTDGATPYHKQVKNMATKFNNPNWEAQIDYYPTPEHIDPLVIRIEQVWDGSKAGHDRLVRQCTEHVESWRDRFGGHYTCYWNIGPERPKTPQDANKVTFVS